MNLDPHWPMALYFLTITVVGMCAVLVWDARK